MVSESKTGLQLEMPDTASGDVRRPEVFKSNWGSPTWGNAERYFQSSLSWLQFIVRRMVGGVKRKGRFVQPKADGKASTRLRSSRERTSPWRGFASLGKRRVKTTEPAKLATEF